MKTNLLQVFEHQNLRIGDRLNDVIFETKHLKALECMAGSNGSPYFSLIHNGVKFNNYVGVISIGNLVIEILPKADKQSRDFNLWQGVLIQMLKESGYLKVKSLSEASLSLRANHILDLYIELFVQEIEFLLHSGLAKNYRLTQGNVNALKGPILFSKHLQQNLVHQERFYVRFQVYDAIHIIHQILSKAIKLLPSITHDSPLLDRIKRIQLTFPEVPSIDVSESLFEKIRFNRRTERYKEALQIAKLLLLNYHPDLSKGSNSVLAILFNMNDLWEKFVFNRIRRVTELESVRGQAKKLFWKSKTIRPDILVKKKSGEVLVLDTKWKIVEDRTPSDEDLKQIFVYNHYFNSKRGILIYPSVSDEGLFSGQYHNLESTCEIAFVKIFDNNSRKLSNEIGKQIITFL